MINLLIFNPVSVGRYISSMYNGQLDPESAFVLVGTKVTKKIRLISRSNGI